LRAKRLKFRALPERGGCILPRDYAVASSLEEILRCFSEQKKLRNVPLERCLFQMLNDVTPDATSPKSRSHCDRAQERNFPVDLQRSGTDDLAAIAGNYEQRSGAACENAWSTRQMYADETPDDEDRADPEQGQEESPPASQASRRGQHTC
jgi:hypothetical protein